MPATNRLSTGNPQLDEMLGGGLIPGTLTVVLGATGIGKTQLGIQFANSGQTQEGKRGIFFDMTARGDSQSHSEYAERIADWNLREFPLDNPPSRDTLWSAEANNYDMLHLFDRGGKRVTRSGMDDDQWREWKLELNKKLEIAIQFFYGNFVHGVRRCVIDGMEPTEKAGDSFQLHTFEYIYHQILRKDAEWVARDLFRVNYRKNAEAIVNHVYDPKGIGCLLLLTSHQVMLDDLIDRPIESDDVLSNANTIILMGKTRSESRVGRALHIAKHRGSAVDESIVPFKIESDGLRLH